MKKETQKVQEKNIVASTASKKLKSVSVSRPKIIKHTLLIDVSPEKSFVLCDGRKIKNCKELAEILRAINDDIFNYHVNDMRNDFSTWITDVFNEKDVSQKIFSIRNRMEMSAELYKNLFEKLEKLNKK